MATAQLATNLGIIGYMALLESSSSLGAWTAVGLSDDFDVTPESIGSEVSGISAAQRWAAFALDLGPDHAPSVVLGSFSAASHSAGSGATPCTKARTQSTIT